MNIIRPQSTRGGFTLMEIMVALLIFGMTLAALATVIHTSTRAWRVGHAISETTQTANVARDVLQRDLENLYYLPEEKYNKAFRRQMRTIAQRIESATGSGGYDARGNRKPTRRGRMAERRASEAAAGITPGGSGETPEGQLSLADVTPPLDLAFRAGGGGEVDELTFARLQPTRWEGDPETLGIRRVRYYVKEEVLYREELDPYGFRPGAAFQIDPENEPLATLGSLIQLFNRDPEMQSTGEYATAEMLEDARLAIPTEVSYAEPLCEGVTRFEMTFGFFRDGLWQEVDTWDSGQVQHRYYESELDDEQPKPIHSSQLAMANPFAQQQMQSQQRADNLPGYLRINIGIQPSGGRGRIQEFTITHALPQAQEEDIYNEERVAEAGGDVETATQFGNDTERDRRRQSRLTAAERRERRERDRELARLERQRNRDGRGYGQPGSRPDYTDSGWGWGSETNY